jgi:hypothetical protein
MELDGARSLGDDQEPVGGEADVGDTSVDEADRSHVLVGELPRDRFAQPTVGDEQ